MRMAPYIPAHPKDNWGAATSTMRHTKTRRRKGGTGLGFPVWWQPWMQMWEIAVAAAEVVAHRAARMDPDYPRAARGQAAGPRYRRSLR